MKQHRHKHKNETCTDCPRETQLQRVVRRTENGEISKGLLRISYKGVSASQFFETPAQLKKILKTTDAEKTIKLLTKLL